MPIKVKQSIRMEVTPPTGSNRWFDTGMVLDVGDSLRIRAEGWYTQQGMGRIIYVYPEGMYSLTPAQHPAFGPEPVLDYADLAFINEDDLFNYIAPDVKPYSLAVLVNDDPEFSIHGQQAGALQPNRDTTFAPEDLGEGRVYVAINKSVAYSKTFFNKFTLVIDRVVDEDDPETLPPEQPKPIPIPPVSPIRESSFSYGGFLDQPLISEKKKTVQRTAYCWFIQPLYSEAESYTNWDIPLECPEYIDEFGLEGNVVPAMTYMPFHGVDLTAIPTEIKMEIKAPDVRMVKFDREKLVKGIYEGAYIELFEVLIDGDRADRILYVVGELGNAEVTSKEAVIELTPIEEAVNRPIGGKIQYQCDVGRLKGETFGRGRCYNLVLNDGPNILDLTRGSKVSQVISSSRLRLTPFMSGAFAAFENGFRGSHGILRGMTGKNSKVIRDVGTFDSSSGLITLRRSMPFLPSINDVFELEAGCDKSPEMCRVWDNMDNFRGFEHVPGRQATRRRYTRS